MESILKKIYIFLHNYLWIAPFFAFMFGYICLQFFMIDTIIQAPNLVGKNILQAVKISSSHKLNVRIITEKEVGDVVPGTIITQNPLPGTSIKAHQSIFIVITKLAVPILAPALINRNIDEIDLVCKEMGLKNKIYFLRSSDPKSQCIGQFPSPGQLIDSKKINTYVSLGNQTQYLFPDLTGAMIEDVIQFLKPYGIVPNYSEVVKNVSDKKPNWMLVHEKSNFIVVNQKPLAGTFVTPNNKLQVYLEIATSP